MKTEELKMLLDALTSMGSAGKEAFIWWLVADKVLPVMLGTLIAILGAIILLRLIKRAWDHDKENQLVAAIAGLLPECRINGSIALGKLYEEVRRLKEKNS